MLGSTGERASQNSRILSKDVSGQETLPAIHLKNRVRWVNPKILVPPLLLPFGLQEGKSSKLALFLDRQKSKVNLGVRLHHGRSADIGRSFFMDLDRKNIYRDIDIKGAGYIDLNPEAAASRSENLLAVRQWQPREEDMYSGLMDRNRAETESRIADELAEKGIRTQRTIAIIDLLELPIYENDTTRLVPIQELKERHVLNEDFNPVIQMRAFGIKTRVADILSYTNSTQSLKELADARLMDQYETSDRSDGFSSYASWFAEQLGINIGKLHRAEYVHRRLTPHNLTLDCRFADLAWVRNREGIDDATWRVACENDFVRAHQSLSQFAKGLGELIPAEFNFGELEGVADLEKYLSICTEAYRRAMTSDTNAS